MLDELKSGTISSRRKRRYQRRQLDSGGGGGRNREVIDRLRRSETFDCEEMT